MQYTTLGTTDLRISRLAFGAMTFGVGESFPGFFHTFDQRQAAEVISRVLDAGINLIDTANIYARGESEQILGQALGARRAEVILATKIGATVPGGAITGGLAYQTVISETEACLRRLDTDYLDLLQLHVTDPATPFEETARALDDLVRRGLTRYVGFCNLSGPEAIAQLGTQRANGYATFVSAQMQYSLLTREIEQDLVPLAQQAGLALLIWGPLAGGFLTGKYTRANPDGDGGRRATFGWPPIDRERGYAVVEALQSVAAAHGATPAQVALAWLLTRPGVSSILLGATKLHQLDDNLAALDVVLSADDLAALEAVSAGVAVPATA